MLLESYSDFIQGIHSTMGSRGKMVKCGFGVYNSEEHAPSPQLDPFIVIHTVECVVY